MTPICSCYLVLYRGKLSFYISVRMCRCLVCHWVCVCVCKSGSIYFEFTYFVYVAYVCHNILHLCLPYITRNYTINMFSLQMFWVVVDSSPTLLRIQYLYFRGCDTILQGSTYHHLYFSQFTLNIRPVYFCLTCDLWCNALSHCYIGLQIGINMLCYETTWNIHV